MNVSRLMALLGIPDVPACVTRHWQGDDGQCWWHCLTCDDGSNQRGRQPHGHKRLSDAAHGAAMHARDKLGVRRGRALYALWWDEITVTPSLPRFIALWEARHGPWRPNVPGKTERQIMLDIQETSRRIMREWKDR